MKQYKLTNLCFIPAFIYAMLFTIVTNFSHTADTVQAFDETPLPIERKWWAADCDTRILIQIESGAFERMNRVVEIEVDQSPILQTHLRKDSQLYLVELTSNGKIKQAGLPVQKMHSINEETSLILIYAEGSTPPNSKRFFDLYISNNNNGQSSSSTIKPVVRNPDVFHEGQNSFHVTTPIGSYFYHIMGAGFASIDDQDGSDWLSYNPGVGEKSQSGSGGMYRGVPNMGYPEGYNHPGKEVSNSRVISEGPLCVRILSESNDGIMQCLWDIFPNYATMTVLKMRTPYWFLYEGTPGGTLDPDMDFCIRPSENGFIHTTVSEKWEGDLPNDNGAEWLFFGDDSRSLALIHHQDDDGMDSYWMMNEEMTVFGFGRSGLNKFMDQVPNRFSVALLNSIDPNTIQRFVQSIHQPLTISISTQIETKPD